MACNCSKRSGAAAQPTGFAARAGGESQQAIQRAGAQQFELRAPSGEKTVHGSRLEASAARVRAGGGSIRPVT